MSHALIIEDNMIVGHAIQQQLAQAGFRSFDHAWTEAQAIDHAKRQTPDLVVIGDGIEQGSALDAARTVRGDGKVPVLLATTHSFRTGNSLPTGFAVHGPCRIDEIGRVVGEELASLLEENFAYS